MRDPKFDKKEAEDLVAELNALVPAEGSRSAPFEISQFTDSQLIIRNSNTGIKIFFPFLFSNVNDKVEASICFDERLSWNDIRGTFRRIHGDDSQPTLGMSLGKLCRSAKRIINHLYLPMIPVIAEYRKIAENAKIKKEETLSYIEKHFGYPERLRAEQCFDRHDKFHIYLTRGSVEFDEHGNMNVSVPFKASDCEKALNVIGVLLDSTEKP